MDDYPMRPLQMDNISNDITIVEFTCYFVHFLFGYYFVKKVAATSLMHPNLRLIMCNIIVEYTLIGVGRIGTRLFSSIDQFPYHSTSLCVFFRLQQDTGILIGGLTFLWIALERLMATVLIRTYEQKNGRVAMAIVLSSVSTLF